MQGSSAYITQQDRRKLVGQLQPACHALGIKACSCSTVTMLLAATST
jgi:hypothetical protein